MIDAILSYHLNPQTCGVAKFNHHLAEKLGVPCLPMLCTPTPHPTYPLVSVKISETPHWSVYTQPYAQFDLFLHDIPTKADVPTLYAASRLYAANIEIARAARTLTWHRSTPVIEAFCPSTLQGNASRGRYRVLTFGMAHKLVLPHFEALKARLEIEHPDYTISLSTAVHEGNPWDDSLSGSTAAMRRIFGSKLRVLGFLGDDALAKELEDCDAVAAYFTPALRANNTTAWAALEAGKPLYTNTDADSPALDPTTHSWDRLLHTLGAHVAV